MDSVVYGVHVRAATRRDKRPDRIGIYYFAYIYIYIKLVGYGRFESGLTHARARQPTTTKPRVNIDDNIARTHAPPAVVANYPRMLTIKIKTIGQVDGRHIAQTRRRMCYVCMDFLASVYLPPRDCSSAHNRPSRPSSSNATQRTTRLAKPKRPSLTETKCAYAAKDVRARRSAQNELRRQQTGFGAARFSRAECVRTEFIMNCVKFLRFCGVFDDGGV